MFRFKYALILTLLLICTTFAKSERPSFVVGFDFSGTARKGYLNYGNPYGLQAKQRDPLWLFGIAVGKRFEIKGPLRPYIGGVVDFGSVDDDTAGQQPLDNGTVRNLVLRSQFVHLGILPELQFPISVSPDANIFFGVGGGLHYVNLREDEYIEGMPNFRVLDPYLETHGMFSFSVHTGAGFELFFSRHVGFAVSYNFQYWNPVNYEYQKDLFPYDPVDYFERFLTHQVQIVVLLKKHV